MSSVISKNPLTEYGTQPYGPSISANLVCTIEQLYDKATSPVHISRSSGLAKIILQGKYKKNITFSLKNAASENMLHSIILHGYVNVMTVTKV